MTSDAASTQPRKRTWKRLIVALACVVAVVTIVFLATPPKPEPVKVWFARATNELGVRKLVFEGTNGARGEITYFAWVVTGAITDAETAPGLPPLDGSASSAVLERESFTFSLEAPLKDVPYYVVWQFHDLSVFSTRWGRTRLACYEFLNTHGMVRLAARFAPTPEMHYIPSSEIKE